MSLSLPPDLEQFVQQELASQAYGSRDDLVVAAVALLRDTKTGMDQLRSELTRRIAELDRGEGIELDSETLGSFFDEIETEVERDLADQQSPPQ